MQTTNSCTRCEPDPLLLVPAPPDETDGSLLFRWGEGDPTAGDELIRRHFAALHRYLRTKVRHDSELEDLVQHTLLACVEARHRYRGEASFRTFLLAIARNRLFEHYRRARCVPSQLSTTALDPATSLTQRLVRGESKARVAGAIAQLSAPMRSVLELSYWNELDVPTIADLLGVPLDTAYSRLHRAKRALRVVLSESRE